MGPAVSGILSHCNGNAAKASRARESEREREKGDGLKVFITYVHVLSHVIRVHVQR